jgi:uncharacterized membrane protein
VTPLVVALVLASAAIHATWNLWTKVIGTDTRAGPLMWTLSALSTLIYAPLAAWVLVSGAWRPSPMVLAWVLGSSVIHVGYLLALMRGYKISDLSVVYPVARGSGPVLAALGAIVLLQEKPTVFSVTGTLLVCAGVLILVVRPGVGRAPHLRAGLAWGFVTGACIAAYTLCDAWSVKRVGIPPLVFQWCGEATLMLLFAPGVVGRRAEVRRLWRDHRARVLGVAALSPLSYIMMLFAVRQGRVSHIAPAREISILLGAWLGAHTLGEHERTRRLVASAAFAAGVIVLAFG